MTTTIQSAALVPAGPVFSDQERLALAGYLAGYSGLTREAYALDLRQFATWCVTHSVCLFQVRRAEHSGRDLEARAVPGPPSPGGCAPSPGPAGMPWKRNCWRK
jgi:hypothetical protein